MALTHLGIGFLLAFVGFITPAMLNMTTVRTSIEQGRRSGILFGLGAATVNAIHSMIAFYFLRYLDDNPDVILWLKRVGVVVLFSLAYFFYTKSKKVIVVKDKKEGVPSYKEGVIMSSINMLGLPYYTVAALALESNGMIYPISPYVYYMSLGVFLGGSSIFGIYSVAAESIFKRSEYITKNINLILSGLFICLGIVVLINVSF